MKRRKRDGAKKRDEESREMEKSNSDEGESQVDVRRREKIESTQE